MDDPFADIAVPAQTDPFADIATPTPVAPRPVPRPAPAPAVSREQELLEQERRRQARIKALRGQLEGSPLGAPTGAVQQELAQLEGQPGLAYQETGRTPEQLEALRADEARETVERQARRQQERPVLSLPGVAGFAQSLAGTAESVKRVLGTTDTESSLARGRQMGDILAGGQREMFGDSLAGRVVGGTINAAGGFVADVPTMIAPGVAIAKRLSSIPTIAANLPYGARAFEQTFAETGDAGRATVDAAIEGLIPAVFGKTGVEKVLADPATRQMLMGMKAKAYEYLKQGSLESVEEMLQEAAGIANDAAHDEQITWEQVLERMAIAGLTGHVAGSAVAAVGDTLGGSPYERALSEAADRQGAIAAALAEPAVGAPLEAFYQEPAPPPEAPVDVVARPATPEAELEAAAAQPETETELLPEQPPVYPPEETAKPAPGEPEVSAAELERQRDALSKQFRVEKDPAARAAIARQVRALGEQISRVDTQRRAGQAGVLMTQAGEELAAAPSLPVAPEQRVEREQAARARQDALLAEDATKPAPKMRKPAAAQAAPVVTETDRAIEAALKAGRPDIVRKLLETPATPAPQGAPITMADFPEAEAPPAPEPEAARTQFMVTKAMRRQLGDLGYTKAQVDAMTPEQAAAAIRDQRGPSAETRTADEPGEPAPPAIPARFAEARRRRPLVTPLQELVEQLPPVSRPDLHNEIIRTPDEGLPALRTKIEGMLQRSGRAVPTPLRMAPRFDQTKLDEPGEPTPPGVLGPVTPSTQEPPRPEAERLAALREEDVQERSASERPAPRTREPQPARPADVEPRAPEGRPAEPLERLEAEMDQQRLAFQSSFTLRVETPMARVADPTNRYAGEHVQLAPLPAAEQRDMKPVTGRDIVTGEQKPVSPAFYYIGQFKNTGKFAVFELKPGTLGAQAQKDGVLTATRPGTTLILPGRVSPELSAEIARRMEMLRLLRTEISQMPRETELEKNAYDEALMDAAKLDREITELVNNDPRLQASNAPYQMTMPAELAKRVHAAEKAGNARLVAELTRPLLFNTFDDAYQSYIKDEAGRARRAVAAETPTASTEQAAALTTTSEEGEAENAGFNVEQDIETLAREPEEARAELEARKESPFARERAEAAAKLNWRNPAEVSRTLLRVAEQIGRAEAAAAQGDRETYRAEMRKAYAYMNGLKAEDAATAFLRAATSGESAQTKAAILKVASIMERRPLATPEDEKPETKTPKEIRKAARTDQEKIDNANPWLANLEKDSDGYLPNHIRQAFQGLPEVPNIGHLPVTVQRAVRLLQASNPAWSFAVMPSAQIDPERKPGGRTLTTADGTARILLGYEHTQESFQNLDTRAKRDLERKLLATLFHEAFHAAMAQGQIRAAVNQAVQDILEEGKPGAVRALLDGFNQITLDGNRYFAKLRTQLIKDEAARRGKTVAAVTADPALKDAVREQVDAKMLEEIVAFAVTTHIRDGLFNGSGAVELAKVVFAHPAFSQTADMRAMLNTMGFDPSVYMNPTVAHRLGGHFNAMADAISAIANQYETEVQHFEDKEAAQAAEGPFSYGTEVEPDPTLQPTLARVTAPEGAGRAALELWRKQATAFTEVAAVAIRAATNRVAVAIERDGKTTIEVIDTWQPTTTMGKRTLGSLRTLARLGVTTKLLPPGRAGAMDEPGDPDSPEAREAALNSLEPPSEDVLREADNVLRQERMEYAKRERAAARRVGKNRELEDQVPAKKPSLLERFHTMVAGLGRVVRGFATQYQDLGLARSLPEAFTAQALDNFYGRVAQGNVRAANAVARVHSPLIALARSGASKATVAEAYDAFGDFLAFRDAERVMNAAIAAGTFVPGKTRILLNKTGGNWKGGTDITEFRARSQEVAQRFWKNSTAVRMAQIYDDHFNALRAEAQRLGMASEEIDEAYFHHQILMFTTPDAKERARKLREMESTGGSIAGLSGAVLKERAEDSVAEYNLNPAESMTEAIISLDRMLARAELQNSILNNVSKHNTVTDNIRERNEETITALLTDFEARGKHQVNAFQFFGSMMNSEHELADRPWVTTHEATLEKLKRAWSLGMDGNAVADAVAAVTPKALGQLVTDALADSPPRFREMLVQAVAGKLYLDPLDYAAAYKVAPELFPEGHIAAPAPFTPKRDSMAPFESAPESGLFNALVKRMAAQHNMAAAAPQAVLPENIGRELGKSLRERLEKMNEDQGTGLMALAKKARAVSVKAQLSTPVTLPRYVLQNVLGNTSAMIYHDPQSLAYYTKATGLLWRYYTAPHLLSNEETAIIKLMEQNDLLTAGMSAELRDSHDPVLHEIARLTMYDDTRPDDPKLVRAMSTAWEASWGRWSRVTSPVRRVVDDAPRVAAFMARAAQDPYYAELAPAMRLGLTGSAWRAVTRFLQGETGMGRERLVAAEAEQAGARSGSILKDVQEGRRGASLIAAQIRGSFGNYASLSAFGESWLGRRFVNPFFGFQDNVVRTTLRSALNDITQPSWSGRAKAGLRGLVLISIVPMLVRALNAAIGDDDDEDYQAFLESDRTNPYFDLYLGKWAGKTRVMGFSTVLGDVMRPLGLDNAEQDIQAAIRYAGTDDWNSLVRFADRVVGRQVGLLFDPQVAYLDMVPTAAGFKWNASGTGTSLFGSTAIGGYQPVYDKTRQLVQPFGFGGFYDVAQPHSGQTWYGLAADVANTRPFDAEGGLIGRAKGAVARFNYAHGRGSRSWIEATSDARLRNSLRQALLRGDNETATVIVDALYDLENRTVGPDNLLKSFGASSVYHRLASDGKLTRSELREQFMRWLPADERELVEHADALQERTFNPWLNPNLKALLLTGARTPEQRFKTQRALLNGLITAVEEAKADGAPTTGAAIQQVAKLYKVPVSTVMIARDLRSVARRAAKRPDKDKVLADAYERAAQRIGLYSAAR